MVSRDFSAVTLSTSRFTLRPLQPSDAQALYGMYSNPQFMRYWSSAPWTSIDQAERMIANDRQDHEAGRHLRLAIIRDADALFVGTCTLFGFGPHGDRAEIGYGIAPQFWGRGYMTEAVGALIAFAFGELGLRRLEADIDPRNAGSARGLEKLGFTREGLLRERWSVAGEVSDSAIYGLLAREFRAR
jgi:RimJ/RimL family protein N-acetyltransferase